MSKYIKYKCDKCNKFFDFNDGTNYSKKCPDCNNELVFWLRFDDDDQLEQNKEIIEYKNELNSQIFNQDEYLNSLAQEVHSIKNMMLFFVILTIIGMIAEFIFFVSLK